MDAAAWFYAQSFTGRAETMRTEPRTTDSVTYERMVAGRWVTYAADRDPLTGLYTSNVREVK